MKKKKSNENYIKIIKFDILHKIKQMIKHYAWRGFMYIILLILLLFLLLFLWCSLKVAHDCDELIEIIENISNL